MSTDDTTKGEYVEGKQDRVENQSLQSPQVAGSDLDLRLKPLKCRIWRPSGGVEVL